MNILSRVGRFSNPAAQVLAGVLLLGPLYLGRATALASNQWYGSVIFSKTFSKESTETFPVGHAYHPGTQLNYEKRTWSGSLRYLPGNQSSVIANYFEKQGSDRKTERTIQCYSGRSASYHDYDLNDATTQVQVNRTLTNSKLTIYILDGKYSVPLFASGGAHQENASKFIARREFYDGCDRDPLKVSDQLRLGSNGMQSVTFANIRGVADPNAQELSGTWTGKDTDGGDLTYTWSFTRKEPKLAAKISQTTPIARGDVVTLSGADSIGKVEKYEWEFVPEEGCLTTAEGAQFRPTGSQVSFVALCDFVAHLKVSNTDSSDSTQLKISVSPREGKAWKTEFRKKSGPPLTSRLFAEQMHLGVNSCSKHSNDETTGHMIHTDATNNATWKGDGFRLAQVVDGGLFQGAWYIKEQSLEIDRMERVNASLLAGGELFVLNQSKGNLASLRSLADQVKAHEETHSALMADYLKQAGPDGDPASQIEKLVGVSEESLQFLADMKVREVETQLREATSEENVKARLQNAGWTRSVKIWFPTVSGNTTERDMGPLWSVGD